jgi:hypothetical protein
VVAAELGRRDPIEARAGLLPKRVNDLDVATDGRPGAVPTHQFVAQALQRFGEARQGRSRELGVLRMPNFSGSPPVRKDARTARR